MNKILKYQGAGKLISLLDDIVKAAKSSPIDFSDWGKLHRSDMLKIPGNKSIVSKLSDSELGYLLYNRNGQILNGTGSRYAIFTGSDPMSVKRINIFDSPGRNTGYLIPEYDDVVPGTVSTHYVENLTSGLSKGISEDSYNALMNITGKPLSANRIWKMPEITEKVYKKFTPGIPNPQFKMMQHKLIDQVGSSGKPAGWSSQKWQEELEWMKKRADIDAGIQDGDELFNTVDDFYEDVMRTPVEAIRPVIQGPTRFVPTKHEFLFQINPQTIKNGTPVVNWSDPNIWLKNGGKIEKHQKGKIIARLFKQWGDDVAKVVRNTKINRALNTKTIKKYIDRELKFDYPISIFGFKQPAPKILTMPKSLDIPANYSEFYKGLQDLSWKDPAFRQFTGYGAYPITSLQFDDVMSDIRSRIQNTKFADDVRQIIDVKSLSSPQHNSLENLIKFNTIDWDKSIGRGLESAVFNGSDPNYVLKTPLATSLIGGRLPNSYFNWINVSGKTVEEMYDNALAFANDFNGKHLFQEPISLIGYRRMRPMHYTGIPKGYTAYIPVFKQLKANELFGRDLPGASRTFLNLQVMDPTKATKLLPEQLVKTLDRSSSYKHLVPQAKSILLDFPKNNIFLENSQLQPILEDPHFGNWGIFDGKLRGIDLHKKGGTIK